ncbi:MULTISPECIES: transglutaminase domain-containing protein [Brachybacterium]|uniref:Transglutaminase domain-containing protein n=1 Tax=Brachybacterium tyrofermentans TaxID=47848 RepID=A0ABW0FHX4_9MICO|nr:transglutaminase domain-containing protein [Brachybacterium alimentarium]
MTNEAQLVEIYESVRNLPYDTAAAHDAASLRDQGRGNCVAKADLLAEELSGVGVECRLISWEYKLPVLVDVQHDVPFDSDVHTAVQVLLSGKWILVDATHDPALAELGLAVGHWDGASATVPAYQAVGSVFPHGRGGLSRELDEALERIGQQVETADPELIARYQHDLNQLFERPRSQATSEGTMPAGR